jgi:hypothetical protein
VPAPGPRGRPALRAYLDGLRAVGRLLDAHPYWFEAIGDRVTVSGVPRLRHADGSVEAIQRWWVYRVAHGKIAAAGSHCTRAEAYATPAPGRRRGRGANGR